MAVAVLYTVFTAHDNTGLGSGHGSPTHTHGTHGSGAHTRYACSCALQFALSAARAAHIYIALMSARASRRRLSCSRDLKAAMGTLYAARALGIRVDMCRERPAVGKIATAH